MKATSILILIATFIISCDTTRIVFKSHPTENSYYTIKALTLSHCGCTFIYATHYTNRENDFQILYNDKIARKTFFTTKDQQQQPQNYFATEDSNFTIPFDSLDKEIFRKIDSLIINKSGIVYELRRANYKGYIKDDRVNY